MAVLYDNESSLALGTGDRSFNHTPTGTPKGVLVFIVDGVTTDQVVGVTYGGSTMTEVPTHSPKVQTGGEGGAVHAFWLGSSIPTGVQSVAIDRGDATNYIAACYTVTAIGNTYILSANSSTSTSTATPGATLTITEDAFVAGGLYAGANSPGSTAVSGTQNTLTGDFGTDTAAISRGTSIKTTDFSYTWSQTADDGTTIVVALADVTKQQWSQAQAKIAGITKQFAQSSALIYSIPQYSEVYDTFTRTVANGWGTSDNAGDWEINDTTGWSVSSNEGRADVSNIGQNPHMHLSKMLAPAKWKISFEYGLLNALPDGDVYIRAYDGGLSSLSASPVGKIVGVRIRSDKTIDFARGFGTGSTFSSSGGTYGSLGDTWVYEMYVWWENEFVLTAGKTWNKAVPGTVYNTQNTFAASADSMPGHISFYAVYLGSTVTYVKIDNFKVTKWMAEPAAQAQAYIKATVSGYSQAQATISVSATVPASIYYAEGLGFSVLGTTWTDAVEIASTNFVANKSYLILVGGFVENDSASSQAEVRVGYGTTPTVFTDGTGSIDSSILTVSKHPFGFMFIHTQGGSAERYVVQVRNSSASQTVAGDVWITVIRLTDELTENTDYYTNSVTADYSTTASYASQASVTFTPNGSDPWLVLGHATRLSPVTDGTSTVKLRVNDSVANALVETNEDGGDIVNDIRPLVMAAVYVPSNVSHTLTVDAAHSGTVAGTIFNSRIFALNLSKFTAVSYERTAGDIVPATDPSWTTVATVSPTPATTGDWLVLGYLTTAFVTVTSTRLLKTRLQINASGGGLVSDPAYGDDAPGMSNWDTADLQPVLYLNKVSLTSGAARTINLDASVVTPPGTYAVRERTLVAVPLLYGAAGAATYRGFAQAQTQIKQIYHSWAQSQTNIKTTYRAWSQANAYIKVTNIEAISQSQAQIAKPLAGIYDYDTFTDTNGTALTSHVSDSGRTWGESFGDMTISSGKITATTNGSNGRMLGAGAADIDARMEVNFGADGISRANAIRFRYSANTDFLFMKVRRSSTPVNQIQLWRRIGGVTDGSPLASVTLEAGEFAANTTYELKVVALGDTIVGYIDGVEKLRTTSTFNQSATGVCITFEETLSTNQTIDNFYLRPPVLGQRSYGQAQASVIKTYQVWSQAQTRIIGIVQVWAQAQSGIKQTYHSWAQTQAKIATTRVHAQAQGSIRKVYQSFAQAQTKIATTRVHAQANTWIKVVNIEAVSQAQTWIKQTYIGVSQAQANIARTYQVFAQAQAKVATTRVHAQSQSNIKQVYRGWSQGNAWIKATYNPAAQSQASIAKTSQVWAQSQTHIKAFNIEAFSQAQASIKTTYTGYAQTQAKISTTRVFAQAQASIAKATPVSAQSLALIYIPVYQRPVADITTNNWVRVVV